jgi:hypothetical protein
MIINKGIPINHLLYGYRSFGILQFTLFKLQFPMENVKYRWFTLIFQYSDVTAYGGSQPRFGDFSDFLSICSASSFAT